MAQIVIGLCYQRVRAVRVMALTLKALCEMEADGGDGISRRNQHGGISSSHLLLSKWRRENSEISSGLVIKFKRQKSQMLAHLEIRRNEMRQLYQYQMQ
jgi:hypothetical protein